MVYVSVAKTVATTYDYDEFGLLVKETSVITITGVTNPYTAITEYSYDVYKNLIKTVSYVVGEELKNGKSIEEWIYDDKGNLLKSFTYNTLDSSSKFYTEHIYDENGKHLADLDVTGEHKTQFEYVDKSGLVKTEKLPNGSKFSYGYDLADNLTAITQSTEDGEENSVSRVYENGLLKKLVSGNTTVSYQYDNKNRLAQVYANGWPVRSYSHFSDYGVDISEMNGPTITVLKDYFGNVTSIRQNNTNVIESNYYDKGLLTSGSKYGVSRTYTYDNNRRLVKTTYADNTTPTTFTYDNYGCITRKTSAERDLQFYYSSDSKHDLHKVSIDGKYEVSFSSDVYGRRTKYNVYNSMARCLNGSETFYLKNGDRTTNLPSEIRYWKESIFGYKDRLQYKYDSMGNIISITENGKLLSKYTYDKLNRLVREDNTAFGKTYLFEYDNTGNITSKRTCPFTLEKKENITVFDEEIIYSYRMDELISINSSPVSMSFDGITNYLGNVISYSRKGLISSFNNTPFLYDIYNRRTAKGNITYTYDKDNLLVSQSNGISFIYDHTSSPIGIKNGTTPYFFRKNAQGDITALLDNDCNIVVKYVYDAWGNHKAYAVNTQTEVETLIYDSVTKTVVTGYENNIGILNPIRYRGYYFDVETNLFLVSSRYYSPELCRWISPDDIEYLDPESVNGLNLYCYCFNNPINYIDPDGHAPKWWESILWGVGIIAVAALATAAIVCSGGSATPFLVVAGQAALGGLKIAAVAGATAGIVRAGKTAIEGGDLGDVGKSLVLGFSDGFFAGSVYAAGSMLLGAASFRISGLINNGYSWSSGISSGGYQTPNTPGISLISVNGGINGGRSFGFDLDIYNSFHFHYKLGEKVKNPFLKKIFGNVKRHRWTFAPIMIGVGVGLSDGWSEW